MYHASMTASLICNPKQSGKTIIVGVSVSVKILKNMMCVKKIIFGILLHVAAKIVNMSQHQTLCLRKSVSINFYILLAFLLIIIALLIEVSIYRLLPDEI